MLQTLNNTLEPPGMTDGDTLPFFTSTAEDLLIRIRSGILIFLQDGRIAADLEAPIADLKQLDRYARKAGAIDISRLSSECAQLLATSMAGVSPTNEQAARKALDNLAEIEAKLLKNPLLDNLEFNISGFLNESFERLTTGHSSPHASEPRDPDDGFEIDEETLEIFQAEASELLDAISTNLERVRKQPSDREAVWNIRRCAHTFKGAAGVVGLKAASRLAHRVEDLLDRSADDEFRISAQMIDLLQTATDHLGAMTGGPVSKKPSMSVESLYSAFDREIVQNDEAKLGSLPSGLGKRNSPIDDSAPTKPPPAPIARVALNKLDELMDLTQELAVNRSSMTAALGEYLASGTDGEIGSLFLEQQQITELIQQRLLQIRMVRFGTVSTRLDRAVHVTCQEEDKKAELIIENEDFEIDTQILSSLVEPLLHLLRNAVVHGIESPERRRLIAKPEKGAIRIRIEAAANAIVISVRDDGQGISLSRLTEKAVSSHLIDPASAHSLNREEILDLVFSRGFTTAETLSMNAGRGIGMSIVRESVGSIGGSISLTTTPQQGTTFTISIPLASPRMVAATLRDSNVTIDHRQTQPGSERPAVCVLVVDDSSSVRQLVKRMIEGAGWTCVTAIDGQDALDILRTSTSRFNVILTDLEMPNLNGYELLEILKNDEGKREIPVIMITSRLDQGLREKAFDLGAADVLTKPFQARALIDTITSHSENITAK